MVTAAAVDLGTNSFRLLVAELSGDKWLPLCKELVTVRLGQGLGQSGVLQPEAMLRGYGALALFAEKLALYRPDRLRVCGTCALRVSLNSASFTAQASELLHRRVEVLSGEEEARLTLLGMLSALGQQVRHPLLLVDVGGGSSEFLLQARPGAQTRQISLPLGAVTLSEEFGPDTLAMAGRIRSILARALHDLFGAGPGGGQSGFLVGSGGTITTLAALDRGLCQYDEDLVQGHVLSQSRLAALCTTLRALSPEERVALPLLAQRRGEIIVAGAMIYEELLRLPGFDRIMVSDAGLLEGILLSGKCATENVE